MLTNGDMGEDFAARLERAIERSGVAPGVGYVLPDGKQTAHPIKQDDWPIIARLEREDQLTYSSDAVRERAERERPPT
jgi:hypothetical protein